MNTEFLSPWFLVLLVALPFLVAVRIWLQRRRRSALRYSSLSLIREAAPRSSRIRRYLPFALFVLAIGSLVIAMAGPVDIVSVPIFSIWHSSLSPGTQAATPAGVPDVPAGLVTLARAIARGRLTLTRRSCRSDGTRTRYPAWAAR